jgi:putative transposase
VVLDILVQQRRDGNAAKRFFRRLLKGLQYVPRVIVTDKLQRRRERQMQRFKSREQAQDFLSAHAFIHGHFHPRRHLLTASSYRAIRNEAFNIWYQETCAHGMIRTRPLSARPKLP